MVNCGVTALEGLQVACHCPLLFSEAKGSVGSPFENETTTLPEFRGFPQSSKTDDSKATGHPAGTRNDWPIEVRVGTSLLGVHPATRAVSPPGAVEFDTLPAPLCTITCSFTLRTLPSENCSVRLPR